MRFILDCMTVVSFTVAAAIVAGGAYVYTNKDALVERARVRVTEEITSAIGEALGGGIAGGLTESLPEAPVEVPAELPVQPPSGFSL